MNAPLEALALDTSVVINVLATGFAREIFRTLAKRCLITEQVMGEVRRDPREPKNTQPLVNYVEQGVLEVVALKEPALSTFVSLVGAPLEDALDDGEAATLALAHHDGHAAAIDETKARVVCSKQFPGLRLVRSVDLFRMDGVVAALSNGRYVEAIRAALQYARMHVPHNERGWIMNLVGEGAAELYPSLRRRT